MCKIENTENMQKIFLLVNHIRNGDLHFSQINELILSDKSTKGYYLSTFFVKTEMAYLHSNKFN